MPIGVKHFTEPMTKAARAELRAEDERWRAMERRIVELEATFRHYHERGDEFPDKCKACALDLRDPIHIRN